MLGTTDSGTRDVFVIRKVLWSSVRDTALIDNELIDSLAHDYRKDMGCGYDRIWLKPPQYECTCVCACVDVVIDSWLR